MICGCEPAKQTPPGSVEETGLKTESQKPANIVEAENLSATSNEKPVTQSENSPKEETPPAEAPTPVAEIQWLLPKEKVAEGWISLFDGATMFGWQPTNDISWRVIDGMITADDPDDSLKPGLLTTTVPFANFEFQCDVRLEKGGNSGVFIRSLANPQDPTADCYEFNLCDTHETFPTGSIVGHQKPTTKIEKEGEWIAIWLSAKGKTIEAKIDGESILKFMDDSEELRKAGYIGLQQNAGKVEFKNIALKPLGFEPLFNGENLNGWQTVPGSVGSFDVVNVEKQPVIHAKSGLGFLESESTWGDFVFQTTVKTNAENLNSGVFFRAEKGTEQARSNGYEMQVHHGFADGDRTKPNDYGTGWGSGAIFRRQKARIVNGNDNEWTAMTLIAYQNRFATWVNGYQVVDFLDERKPDPNPRKGLRLDAGHFSLQGHDPTTDLYFREIKAAPLPKIAE